jgi:RNA-directed DNA polymerase
MTDLNYPNSTVGEDAQRLPSKPALGEMLLERILCSENILLAWRQVKQNAGAAGIDGTTIEQFPSWARKNFNSIRKSIASGKYKPSAVKRCYIPKRTGGKRPLGIPTVLDRVIQQAVVQILNPIFDPGFSESSFGFRPARNAHQAVKQIQSYIKQGYTTSIEVDLKSFFDEVNHDLLMNRVAQKCKDKRVLKLIGKYLRAGVWEDGEVKPTSKGVPQGGNLSPLLSNIMLDVLDRELEKRGHLFARYADDFVIQVKSKRAGERVKESVTRFIEKKLKLKVNKDKSSSGHNTKCKFLGFSFYSKGHIKLTESALKEFKYKIRKLTSRSRFVSIEQRILELNYYIAGWFQYYGLSQYWNPIPVLDEWIRRRIRMCLLKQWRYVRVKVRNLIKLGAQLRTAIANAMSPCSYWAQARFLSAHTGLTNNHIHQTLGLVSIKKLWIALHYPT